MRKSTWIFATWRCSVSLFKPATWFSFYGQRWVRSRLRKVLNMISEVVEWCWVSIQPNSIHFHPFSTVVRHPIIMTWPIPYPYHTHTIPIPYPYHTQNIQWCHLYNWLYRSPVACGLESCREMADNEQSSAQLKPCATPQKINGMKRNAQKKTPWHLVITAESHHLGTSIWIYFYSNAA